MTTYGFGSNIVAETAVTNRQHAGRKPIADRAVLTGILFVLRSDIPWNTTDVILTALGISSPASR
jgi:hypothetical protein